MSLSTFNKRSSANDRQIKFFFRVDSLDLSEIFVRFSVFLSVQINKEF